VVPISFRKIYGPYQLPGTIFPRNRYLPEKRSSSSQFGQAASRTGRSEAIFGRHNMSSLISAAFWRRYGLPLRVTLR